MTATVTVPTAKPKNPHLDSLEVVVSGALYLGILARLGAWWTVGESVLCPKRVVTCAAVEAWRRRAMSAPAVLIQRNRTGWLMEADAEAKAVLGCSWIPLPLTAQCSERDALAFAAATPMAAGRRVVVVGPS